MSFDMVRLWRKTCLPPTPAVLRIIHHIAKNTFRECLRQPIFVILLLSTLTIIGTYPRMSMFVFREQEKLVTDGALATILIFGWITAVLCASHSIHREIETGTVLLILSKPVNRALFIIAKIFGIVSALTVFVWISGIGALFAVRIASDQFEIDWGVMVLYFAGIIIAMLYGAFANFRRSRSFSSSTTLSLCLIFTVLLVVVYFLPPYDFGYKWDKEHIGYSTNLIAAIILILFAVWAMATLATALSTQFNLVSNLTVCAIVFMVGLVPDFIYYQVIEMELSTLKAMMHFWFFGLIPFLLLFWLITVKHFHHRRQQRLSLWNVNLAFGVTLAALIIHGIVKVLTRVHLGKETILMNHSARLLYSIKTVLAELFHSVVPNWQLFWMADALAKKATIPVSYLALGASYIITFIFVFFGFALLLFYGHEVGRQTQR